MASKTGKTQVEIEWDNRVLCSDESCIGVIGPDGRCRECGRPYEGELHWTTNDGEAAAEPASELEEFDNEASEMEPDAEWESRVLCSDESCIGVIGPDGRCKECGKPFK